MYVTIWDLDYYYAKKKQNCFNSDAMRVSSYHKQKGDQINFVQNVYDIRRPYDLYYIFKEKPNTPNPPADFFLDSKVRWVGSAFKFRNWTLPDIIMAVRPDYLLYPEKNTVEEKSAHIRLFNKRAKLLPRIQDYTNTYKGIKRVLLTDKYIWYASREDILAALNILSQVESLAFCEPIWIPKILSDPDIRDAFLSLPLEPGARLRWQPITEKYFEETFQFFQEMQEKWPKVRLGALRVDIRLHHWEHPEQAIKDFNWIKEIIIRGKHAGIHVQIEEFNNWNETPYFFLFNMISNWTSKGQYNLSWYEFLINKFKAFDKANKPQYWYDSFRDLLRQTYEDKEFLLLKWKNTYYSDNEIPWSLWVEEFKLGI